MGESAAAERLTEHHANEGAQERPLSVASTGSNGALTSVASRFLGSGPAAIFELIRANRSAAPGHG